MFDSCRDYHFHGEFDQKSNSLSFFAAIRSPCCTNPKRNMSRYTIQRECWNEKTYNGYEDSPYWRITFDGGLRKVGLKDDGRFWPIDDTPVQDRWYLEDRLQTIIDECKLNIKLKTTEEE